MKKNFDLNLLRFLNRLHRLQSLHKVCQRADISRATFNRYLSECRELFGNELFVVNKGHYQPTLLCDQLIEHLDGPLSKLEQSPQTAALFDTPDSALEFVFCIINPLSELLTLPLVESLTEHRSPKISFVDWTPDRIAHPHAGEITIGIAGYPNQFGEHLIEKKVGSVPLYAYVSRTDCLASQSYVDLAQLNNRATVRLSLGAFDGSLFYERVRKQLGVVLQQQLTVSSSSSALKCVETGSHVLVCTNLDDIKSPEVVQLPLHIGEQPMHFEVGIHYNRGHYQHPMVVQLEHRIRSALKQ